MNYELSLTHQRSLLVDLILNSSHLHGSGSFLSWHASMMRNIWIIGPSNCPSNDEENIGIIDLMVGMVKIINPMIENMWIADCMVETPWIIQTMMKYMRVNDATVETSKIIDPMWIVDHMVETTLDYWSNDERYVDYQSNNGNITITDCIMEIL